MMTMTIEQLENEIRRHSKLYHTDNAPEITDAEFDGLVAELRARKSDSVVLTEIGAPIDAVTYGTKVKHPTPMGSLNKASDYDALIAWWTKMGCPTLVASPKMDGCAIRLVYENGVLTVAATRGDGTEGQLATDNARAIKDIPAALAGPWTGEVRGEVYMKRTVFQKLNDAGAGLKNPRNSASGAMGLQDPKEVARRELSFACYGHTNPSVPQDTDKLATLLPRGIADVCVPFSNPCVTENDIKNVVDYWTGMRPTLDYEIDGIVFAIKDAMALDAAGVSSNCPNGAIAYKFPTEQVETQVVEQPWTVGRTGKITPMAIMKPVQLAGTTVTRASLGSWNVLTDLGLAVGDTVLLEKGGDIIPHIVRVTDKGPGPMVVPTLCPVCGQTLVQEGAHLWCRNPFCQAKLEERVLFYLRTLGIKGIGPAFVSAVCGAGHLVKTLPDLYCLDPNDVAVLLGSEVTANQSVLAILDKHTVALPVFLDSLGIHGMGTQVSAQLTEEYGDLETILNVTLDQLLALPGFQKTKATAVIEGLAANEKEIRELASILTIAVPEKKSGGLSGQSFCLTGTMSRPRAELAEMIENAGGTVKSSVGRGLTYLVQADPTSTSGKTRAAAKHGVTVIGEAELLRMTGQ